MDSEILHVGATVKDIDWHRNFLASIFSMKVLSDSPREGEWIDKVTSLDGFQARNVYVTPDEINRIELFQIFHPPLAPVPLAYGAFLGIAHLGVGVRYLAPIAEYLNQQRHCLKEYEDDEFENSIFFQDKSGINWKISQLDNLDDIQVTEEKQTQITHIRLIVSNLQKALGIYSHFLGLVSVNVSSRRILFQNSNGQWLTTQAAICRLCTGKMQILELCQYTNFSPLPNPRKKINCLGLHHIAFKIDDAVAVFKMLQETDCSAISEPQSIPMGPNRGGVLFYFCDQDGTILEFLQPPIKKS